MSTSGSALDVSLPVVHYLRKTVNYNDPGIGTTGVKVGTLPSGAFIGHCFVRVETAFNAATTNVLTVGTNASTYNNIAGSGDVTEGSLQTQVITAGTGLSLTADTDVYALYTQTGTAASAGKATIVLSFATGG